ncbi:MAG: cyclic-di-AMP receptor [Armatimonadota bacterium]
MKLVVTIIHDRDKHRISEALLRSNFKFTKLASTGGFLREGNVTFLIGVEVRRLDELMNLISENCKSRDQYANFIPPDAGAIGVFMPSPVKVQVGGAVAFVIDIDRFERF